jgi:hypothetical protein
MQRQSENTATALPTLPPISSLFEDPFNNPVTSIYLENEEQGLKCELKTYAARLNSKGDRVYLHAGTRRSFDPQISTENHQSALVQTRFYDREGELSYTETEIRSAHIKKALREVVGSSYPDMEAEPQKLVMQNFKECMFHYHKELREYGKHLKDPVAANHLDFALQHLYKELNHEMQLFNKNVEADYVEPRLNFRNLWMAFRPGDLVHQKVRKIDVLYRISKTRYDIPWRWSSLFVLSLISLDFDGTAFGYTETTWSIPEFLCQGFTPLRELSVRPLKYIAEEERKAILAAVHARGKRFLSLSRDIHHCEYHGIADMLSEAVIEEEEKLYDSIAMMVRSTDLPNHY